MKIIVLLGSVFFISGCTCENTNVIEYKDENNVKLGLFLYDNNYRNKKRIEDTYYTDFISGTDIGSFEVFLTDNGVIDGVNFKDTWYKYYNEYEDISDIKIGYNIKFILEDGTNYEANYFEPDTYKFSDYFYTYLYDDVNVLKNLADIKDSELLRKAEADITGLSMAAIYDYKYDKFNTETLQDIHRNIFGQIFDWAGEFRTIQMVKYEDVLGGDTVRYAYPKEIKKQLNETMKEIAKLKRTGDNDKDIVFKLVRIIASIWQTHPFREGNTRTVIVFAVLLAKSLGFEVEHELFKTNSAYVRNALVWASQGIYSKYEYLERIFFDAILGEDNETDTPVETKATKYDTIGEYKVKDYKERPHEYKEE